MAYEDRFTAIADAIRGKLWTSAQITATSFASAIGGIAPQLLARDTPRSVTPGGSNLSGAYNAVLAAMSYWNAKQSGSKAWAYSDGHGCLKDGAVNDSSGKGVMDCSTYMGLVLRGLDYLASPYGRFEAAGATCNPDTVVDNGEAWTEAYLDQQTRAEASNLGKKLGDDYRALTAADVAAYYASYGLAWKWGEREARIGDLVFMNHVNDDGTLKYPNRWMGMSHIGIMCDASGYLNITDYASTGNLIRTNLSARQPIMCARPLYGGLTYGASDKLDGLIATNLLPRCWAGFKQGTSTVNGLSVTCTGRALSFSGTPTSNINRNILHNSLPLLLPAGTYKLSGFVNGTGTNTVSAEHSLWGMRVFNADTGAGVAGTTTSSNGNNTAQRNPVWDIGGGCTFTLSAPTRVAVDLYLGTRDSSMLSCNPVLKPVS